MNNLQLIAQIVRNIYVRKCQFVLMIINDIFIWPLFLGPSKMA